MFKFLLSVFICFHSLLSLYAQNITDLKIKLDHSNQKYGLINSENIWIISPEFETLQKINTFFFLGKKDNATYIYRYDINVNKLIRINYQLFDSKIYLNTYVIIQQYNGPKGIMDIYGNIILPTYYTSIWIKDTFFIGELNNQFFLYDQNGNKLLSDPAKHIDIKNNWIYVKKEDSKFPNNEKTSVYSSLLSPITKEEWTACGKFGKDHLLLIKTLNNELFYIDESGTIQIPPSHQFNFEGPFSNGYAIVSSKKYPKKYGFINNFGKIIIPLEYDDVGPFQKKYAFIEKSEKGKIIQGLIDSNNNIIKIFPATVLSRSTYYDSNEVTYYLSNMETYDADGNFKEDINLIR